MSTDPIRRLLDEHHELMAGFEPLRRAARDLAARGDAALPEARPVLVAAARLMQERLLLHAKKEDDALFPALEAVFGEGSGVTAVMREEHRDIHAEADRFRATLRELNEVEHPAIVAGAESLRALSSGGGDARTLRATAERLLELLDAHFSKEETVLFPMALDLLDAAALRRVGEAMDALEAAAGS